MYQMATVFNNMPNNTNLELVLDIDSLALLGVSEAGTSKTLHMQQNPNVSISWCRQLRPHEEETYNYYCSYGIQFDGVVRIFTPADMQTEEGKAKLLNLFDKYYPTLATSWMGYAATFAGLTDEVAITAAKLGYIEKQLNGGAMVIYEVVPTRIIVTAPKSPDSIRTIPLAPDMVRLLHSLPGPRRGYFLSGGSITEPRTMQHHFARAAESSGITGATFHTLRHTFATRCVELGFDPKSLSEILGHSTVNLTMNRYVHPTMDLKRCNMQRLHLS
jgi:hypothetical protein